MIHFTCPMLKKKRTFYKAGETIALHKFKYGLLSPVEGRSVWILHSLLQVIEQWTGNVELVARIASEILSENLLCSLFYKLVLRSLAPEIFKVFHFNNECEI